MSPARQLLILVVVPLSRLLAIVSGLASTTRIGRIFGWEESFDGTCSSIWWHLIILNGEWWGIWFFWIMVPKWLRSKRFPALYDADRENRHD